MFRLAGVSSAATSLHFLVNLRTPDHFDAFVSLSIERTRQKYAPLGSVLLLTKRRF